MTVALIEPGSGKKKYCLTVTLTMLGSESNTV